MCRQSRASAAGQLEVICYGVGCLRCGRMSSSWLCIGLQWLILLTLLLWFLLLLSLLAPAMLKIRPAAGAWPSTTLVSMVHILIEQTPF